MASADAFQEVESAVFRVALLATGVFRVVMVLGRLAHAHALHVLHVNQAS